MKNLFPISGIGFVCLMLSLLPFGSAQALLFDFEDEAQLEEWNIISGTWQIEQDDISKSNVASGEGVDDLILEIGDESWTGYTVEFEASGLTDDIGIVFRFQDLNNYTAFLIAPSVNLSEWFVKQGGVYNEAVGNKGDGRGVSTNEWHKYKLVVEGMQASIFIDGEEPFEPLEIMNDFKSGGIGLRQWSDHGHYDNVLIYGPGIPLSPGEPVEPNGKLAGVWGGVKAQR